MSQRYGQNRLRNQTYIIGLTRLGCRVQTNIPKTTFLDSGNLKMDISAKNFTTIFNSSRNFLYTTYMPEIEN